MKRKILLFSALMLCLMVVMSVIASPVMAYSKNNPLIIVLDPGHGGPDPGAGNGVANEREINLKIAKYCKAELEQYANVKVYLTRTTNDLSDKNKKDLKDGKLSLSYRGNFAGKKNANALISIHCNSAPKNTLRGAEIWYPINVSWCSSAHTIGKGLSSSILSQLTGLGLANRGAKTRVTTLPLTEKYPDGSVMDYYTVINSARSCHVPAIIIEHAYINNLSDYNTFLNTDEKLKKLGVADAKGIIQYFKKNKSVWIFNDVRAGANWYSKPVEYMKEKGYISGYKNGCFGPNDKIQRQDFVVILARIAKIKTSEYNKKSKFSDVKKDCYYTGAVNWANKAGIIKGYTNGEFGVGDYLTREQLVSILYNYTKNYLKLSVKTEGKEATKYADYNTVSGYAKKAMIWAVDKKLISGFDKSTLGPISCAERSHVAKILMNAELNGIFEKPADKTETKPVTEKDTTNTKPDTETAETDTKKTDTDNAETKTDTGKTEAETTKPKTDAAATNTDASKTGTDTAKDNTGTKKTTKSSDTSNPATAK